jgi:hypothetical protein
VVVNLFVIAAAIVVIIGMVVVLRYVVTSVEGVVGVISEL